MPERMIDSLSHMISDHRKATTAILVVSFVLGIIFGSAIA